MSDTENINQSENLAKWYIAKCPSGAEETAVRMLKEKLEKIKAEELLIESFIPYAKKEKKYGKRSIMANYIFLKLILNSQSQKAISQLNNLSLMIEDGENYTIISEEQIIKMRLNLENSEREDNKEFEVGEEIIVKEAPFENFKGIIEKIEATKVTVSVPIFGRQMSLELPFHSITRIKD